ncbi:hypothetical protein E2C01_025070 [Portunus trituberculatus]|uniref:Uncharacterized protein n=1 Tax=Portunus trituberculatus TaxID=210409 RepID=A0A5B7EGV5_PORTR|nr:hypothetical protein [Portunus trituberculatus]
MVFLPSFLDSIYSNYRPGSERIELFPLSRSTAGSDERLPSPPRSAASSHSWAQRGSTIHSGRDVGQTAWDWKYLQISFIFLLCCQP